MSDQSLNPVLLTGATGFVGNALYKPLTNKGYEVLCASRDPDSAREKHPERKWIKFDVHQPETIRDAFERCESVFYLIHEMSAGEGYKEREQNAAQDVIRIADETGIQRMVYLGGVAPQGEPSEHLKSRIETGRILRSGKTSTIELRASMIIGSGSSSWRIVRDLAARLPIMLLPSWTRSRSQPVYIGDVVAALIGALELDETGSEWFDIPGPDTLSIAEILQRTARKLNNNPYNIHVPLLTPKLSSYWLRFVTRGDLYLARELVEGLKNDLLAESDEFWDRINHEHRMNFEESVEMVLRNTESDSLGALLYESLVKLVTSRHATT